MADERNKSSGAFPRMVVVIYSQNPGYQHLKPEDLKKTVNYVCERLSQLELPIDALAVMGVSGLLVGSAVSYKTGISLIIVRKEKSCHDFMTVLGAYDCDAYLILDDFFDTGKTVATIIDKINMLPTTGKKKCQGALFYNWRDPQMFILNCDWPNAIKQLNISVFT